MVGFRSFSGHKVDNVTRTPRTTFLEEAKKISQGDPFLFLMLYFNNSTDKGNTANITLIIDIFLHSPLLICIHFMCCLQCAHIIYSLVKFLMNPQYPIFHGPAASIWVMYCRAGRAVDLCTGVWLEAKSTLLCPSFLSSSRFLLRKRDLHASWYEEFLSFLLHCYYTLQKR